MTAQEVLISRLVPIGAEIANIASGSNFSVNSRPKNCGGYTVGSCPSASKICADKSTMKRDPKPLSGSSAAGWYRAV